jgi:hypothetical protein
MVKKKKTTTEEKDNATMTTYKVRLTFEEPLLGTAPKNQSIYATYIASKKADMTPEETQDEVSSVEDMESKCWTGFHTTEDNKPFIYDYHIKGFFKDCCSMLTRAKGSASSRVRAFRKIIDGLVFISPRRIPINLSGPVGILERPLRANTPQGERVALTRSDFAPAGSTIEFEVKVIGDDVTEDLLTEWFDYAKLRGLGQWRNASWGTATYTMEEV